MADSAALEYRTNVFELAMDDVAVVNPGGVNLDSFLSHLSQSEGWQVVGVTGGLGNQRKGVVLLQRARR